MALKVIAFIVHSQPQCAFSETMKCDDDTHIGRHKNIFFSFYSLDLKIPLIWRHKYRYFQILRI